MRTDHQGRMTRRKLLDLCLRHESDLVAAWCCSSRYHRGCSLIQHGSSSSSSNNNSLGGGSGVVPCVLSFGGVLLRRHVDAWKRTQSGLSAQHPGLWKGTSTQISRAPYMLLAILRPAMVCVIVYIPIGNQYNRIIIILKVVEKRKRIHSVLKIMIWTNFMEL